ncbi:MULTISPECIES: outer membrane lipoprotein-sorting protein [Acidobacteriaceae]|uniref:LolA family protein n=1 Tax=Acidobacteriaceae TaxID=204434 RepID=UPI0020B11F6C|nr:MULTISPECIES: outer membrane lipoprotein-sorting protein [Acidobacteriaceae]MDW5266596.1 outer membrane lipoprotein-sorting protein [Edaphobacter sp.]
MMNFRRAATAFLIPAAALLMTPLSSFAQPKPADLNTVLHEMDQASAKFKSAEADFRWDIYERVVKETTTQTGTAYFLKSGSNLQMGLQIKPPSAKFVEYKNGNLQLFDPGSDHLTILSAGNNQAQYESFLTLGFGGSGTDLAKSWTVTDLGTEPINDGSKMVTTTKLDLVSKDPNVRNMVSHITIWVDPTRAVSLKQQFFMPSEDQRTTYFTNIRYNQTVNTKPFALKTDKKTTVDRR